MTDNSPDTPKISDSDKPRIIFFQGLETFGNFDLSFRGRRWASPHVEYGPQSVEGWYDSFRQMEGEDRPHDGRVQLRPNLDLCRVRVIHFFFQDPECGAKKRSLSHKYFFVTLCCCFVSDISKCEARENFLMLLLHLTTLRQLLSLNYMKKIISM